MKKLVILLISLIISSPALSKEGIIEDGFKAFKDGGATAAWPAWAKGGPMEGSKELAASASQFGSIGAYYGNYVSHDYVSEKELSENNKVVYVIMNMDTGPLYGVFYIYKLANGKWVAPNFFFHTQAPQVWPASIYATCGK